MLARMCVGTAASVRSSGMVGVPLYWGERVDGIVQPALHYLHTSLHLGESLAIPLS